MIVIIVFAIIFGVGLISKKHSVSSNNAHSALYWGSNSNTFTFSSNQSWKLYWEEMDNLWSINIEELQNIVSKAIEKQTCIIIDNISSLIHDIKNLES